MDMPSATGLAGALFALLLGIACVSDVRERRIPNTLVAVLLVLGLGVAAAQDASGEAVRDAAGGAATGFALWFPLWLLHVVGAGDVKLFAAASTWLGPFHAVEGALLAALYGGALAVLFMLRGRGIAFTVVRLAHAVRQPGILHDDAGPGAAGSPRLPYALAMAGGVATAAWFPGVLL